MNITDVLTRIQSSGIILQADGDRLVANGNQQLTEQQRQFIRQHKTAILEALAVKPDKPTATGTVPYRLNIDGRVQLVWLAPGLETDEVIQRAKTHHPGVEVSDESPPQGWPRLADIPPIPKSSEPRQVEAWTSSGTKLIVTAYSGEHAEQVQMNPPPMDADDRQEAYEERVAIMHFDGDVSMKEAEQKAGTCYYCRHWRGTKSGKGYCCIGFAPPIRRIASESCEQFTLV